MSKKIAVVLSGCGYLDGAEINEAVLTLLHLYKNQATPVCFAPNVSQAHVSDHLLQNSTQETRNVLIESARIARGEVQDLKQLSENDFDALVFPGGFGAALNLCDFAKNGVDCTILPEVENAILSFAKAQKPMGFICIAPALAAKALGNKQVKITIGNDADTMQALKALGADPQVTKVDQICVDDYLKVVSTPAYMLATNPFEAEAGIEKLVKKVLKMG